MNAAVTTPSTKEVTNERVQYSSFSMSRGLEPCWTLKAKASSGALTGHRQAMVAVQASVPRTKLYNSMRVIAFPRRHNPDQVPRVCSQPTCSVRPVGGTNQRERQAPLAIQHDC